MLSETAEIDRLTNIHLTADIPYNWVVQGLQNNPRMHFYTDRAINIASDNPGSGWVTGRSGLNTRGSRITLTDLVSSLSAGPNRHTAGLIGTQRQKLLELFGEGRMPLGRMNNQQLTQMFTVVYQLIDPLELDRDLPTATTSFS